MKQNFYQLAALLKTFEGMPVLQLVKKTKLFDFSFVLIVIYAPLRTRTRFWMEASGTHEVNERIDYLEKKAGIQFIRVETCAMEEDTLEYYVRELSDDPLAVELVLK